MKRHTVHHRKLRTHASRYIVRVKYKGFDPAFDRQLMSVAGREFVGSGYDLVKQLRDVDFAFTQLTAARQCAARLRRVRGVRVGVATVPASRRMGRKPH
jgi:hypothetical protein